VRSTGAIGSSTSVAGAPSGGTIRRTVTTSAPRPPLSEPTGGSNDPRTIRAWRLYRESTRGLTGTEYEAAETRAWERLQRMLAEISHGRRRIDVRA